MARPEFVSMIVQILSRFDIVVIQEIKDSTGTEVIVGLSNALNEHVAGTGIKYEYVISPRLGLGAYKEQLAFLYRASNTELDRNIQVLYNYVYDDTLQIYDRPPYIAKFQLTNAKLSIDSFVLMGVHLRPTNVYNESLELQNVVTRHLLFHNADDNIAIMGDFNFDCGYISALKRNAIRAQLSDFTWYINDDVATTISTSNCTYDRVLINTQKFKDAIVPFSNNSYRYDYVYGLTTDQASTISDHYPVEIQLQ